MRNWITLLICILLGPSLAAEPISKSTLGLMEDLDANCRRLLEMPSPSLDSGNRETQYFKDHIRYIERDLKELRRINPKAENSNHVFRKTPFNENLKAALARIEKEKGVTSNPYNSEALVAIGTAIFDAKMGMKWLENPKKYNATINAFKMNYKSYITNKEKAFRLDPRVLEFKKAALAECEKEFAEPVRIMIKEHAEDVAAAKKLEETRRQIQQEVHLIHAERASEEQRKIAKQHGFDGYHKGIASLLEDLRIGVIDLPTAKKKLLIAREADRFTVSNTLEDHVIYTLSGSSASPVQVVIERERDAFYGEGSPLPSIYFRVVGTERFQTVLGASVDLIVLRKSTPSPKGTLEN